MKKTKKKIAAKKKTTKRKVVAKKKVVKKSAKKGKAPKAIGVITHFFGKIKVAIVRAKRVLKVGEMVRFLGATTNFTMKIASMQYEHESVKQAKKGQEVGIKVGKRVREGDQLYEAE